MAQEWKVSKMNKKELLPCPFCGGEAEVVTDLIFTNGKPTKVYQVYCRENRCVIGFCDYAYYMTEEEAINAWNTRTYKPAGKWKIDIDEYKICATEFVCSNCNESFCTSEMTDEEFMEMMKYCPNCGEKMEGVDNG